MDEKLHLTRRLKNEVHIGDFIVGWSIEVILKEKGSQLEKWLYLAPFFH